MAADLLPFDRGAMVLRGATEHELLLARRRIRSTELAMQRFELRRAARLREMARRPWHPAIMGVWPDPPPGPPATDLKGI